MTINCLVCKKEFAVKPSHILKRKHCSMECKVQSPKSMEWSKYLGSHFKDKNKGTTGYKFTTEQREKLSIAHLGKKRTPEAIAKMRESLIKNASNRKDWKGDNAGYGAIHERIKVRLGRPSKCEHCKTTTAKKYEWANISKEYKTDLDDWIRLCVSCHKRYDFGNKQTKFNLK